MKNTTKIMILLIVAILVVVGVFLILKFVGNTSKTNLEPVEKAEDLSNLIDKVYEGKEDVLPRLNTTIVDVANVDNVKAVTGLENVDNFEYVVVSEPLMSSQAYSFVLAKVKKGVDSDNIAKEMSEKVDPRKWICVSAEKIYATSSGDVVCLVMASQEWGKPVYDSFKSLAGNINTEYEKTVEEF